MELFLGIAIGIIIYAIANKYVLPLLDMNLEVYSCKLQEKATKSQLDNEEQKILFGQKYPEIQSDDGKYMATDAIGFHAAEEFSFEEE